MKKKNLMLFATQQIVQALCFNVSKCLHYSKLDEYSKTELSHVHIYGFMGLKKLN